MGRLRLIRLIGFLVTTITLILVLLVSNWFLIPAGISASFWMWSDIKIERILHPELDEN